jgi:hypothetical protein
MSTIFVTGGSGFIGGALLPALAAAGHHTIALARSGPAKARVATSAASYTVMFSRSSQRRRSSGRCGERWIGVASRSPGASSARRSRTRPLTSAIAAPTVAPMLTKKHVTNLAQVKLTFLEMARYPTG